MASSSSASREQGPKTPITVQLIELRGSQLLPRAGTEMAAALDHLRIYVIREQDEMSCRNSSVPSIKS